LAIILGSSTCHLAMSAEPILGSGMGGCYPDAVTEGTYTLEGGQTATGSILDWFRRHFAAGSTFEELDAKAAAVPPGGEGLVCLDHWQGNRCPHKDPHSRGALWGFTLAHGPGHVVRAVYEGTACGTRAILDDLAAHGFSARKLFVGGGGAKSRLWLQVHADVLNQPVHVPADAEACALGSAMMAAVRAGRFASFPEAAAAMVRLAEVVEPRPGHRPAYDELFGKYQATYRALRPLTTS
jgi:ribulose kinase